MRNIVVLGDRGPGLLFTLFALFNLLPLATWCFLLSASSVLVVQFSFLFFVFLFHLHVFAIYLLCHLTLSHDCQLLLEQLVHHSDEPRAAMVHALVAKQVDRLLIGVDTADLLLLDFHILADDGVGQAQTD